NSQLTTIDPSLKDTEGTLVTTENGLTAIDGVLHNADATSIKGILGDVTAINGGSSSGLTAIKADLDQATFLLNNQNNIQAHARNICSGIGAALPSSTRRRKPPTRSCRRPLP